MAFHNLTQTELESLKSGQAVDRINKIFDQIETEDGTKKLPKEYCKNWPLLRFALTAAKFFTPESVDKKVDEIIAAGDAACSI